MQFHQFLEPVSETSQEHDGFINPFPLIFVIPVDASVQQAEQVKFSNMRTVKNISSRLDSGVNLTVML
jgi:hypothetical protein